MLKLKRFACFFIAFLLVSGCTPDNEKPEEITKSDISEQNTSVLYQLEHGIKGYDGKTLDLSFFQEFPYQINNQGKAFDLGILLFADGYLQPYKTSYENHNDYLHIIKASDSEKVDFKIYMEDYILDDKQEHTFNIGGILNPHRIESLVSYQVNHSISQSSGIKVTSPENTSFASQPIPKKSSLSFEKVTEEDMDQMEITDINELSQTMKIQILQNGVESLDYLDPNKKIELKATGDYGNYNVYIFLDGKPYNPDTYFYSFETKPGYFSTLQIDLPEDIQTYKNFFLVLAPKNSGNYIEQSNCYMIGSEEK